MTRVTKEFTYYDDGTFPVVHEIGEEVEGEVEAFAISEGFTGDASVVLPVYVAKHRGGGKWDVYGPDGIVTPDLDGPTAKATAVELNTPAA
jgi:hypothetical protein